MAMLSRQFSNEDFDSFYFRAKIILWIAVKFEKIAKSEIG
jgi:hypothetical protein